MKQPTVNYRNKHIVIILGCLYLFVSGLLFKGHNNFLDLGLFFVVLGVQSVFQKNRNYEKEDELVRENLNKANTVALIAFFVLSAIIPIVYLEANLAPVDISDFYNNPYFYMAIGICIIRSSSYLFFDRPVREEE